MRIKGFTLTEILAVVVILGIILIIAVPSVNNIIETSKNKIFITDAHLLINAANLKSNTEDLDGKYFYTIDELDVNTDKYEEGCVFKYNNQEYIYLKQKNGKVIGTIANNQIVAINKKILNLDAITEVKTRNISYAWDNEEKVILLREDLNKILGNNVVYIKKRDDLLVTEELSKTGDIKFLKTNSGKCYPFLVINDNKDSISLLKKVILEEDELFVRKESLERQKQLYKSYDFGQDFSYIYLLSVAHINSIIYNSEDYTINYEQLAAFLIPNARRNDEKMYWPICNRSNYDSSQKCRAYWTYYSNFFFLSDNEKCTTFSTPDSGNCPFLNVGFEEVILYLSSGSNSNVTSVEITDKGPKVVTAPNRRVRFFPAFVFDIKDSDKDGKIENIYDDFSVCEGV